MISSYNILNDKNKLINMLFIGYAFCLPISKAGVNLFEILVIIIWLLEGNWNKKIKLLKQNLLSISILLLISVSLISVFWSVDTEYALNYIAKYRHFLIILIMFTSLKKEYIQYIISAFLMGMFVSELISYGIFFELFRYKNISPTDPSPFMSHTDYSAYLAFTSILILGRILSVENSIKIKLIYGFFFITVTGNLFINGGRTGQIIFVLILIITFLLSLKNKFKAIINSIVILCFIFSLAYIFSSNFKNRADYAINDVTNMIVDNNFSGSFATRVQLWIVGYDKIVSNSLIGSGIGNEMDKADLFSKNRDFNERDLSYFSDHHNSFITLTIQLGIFGILILYMIFYSLFRLKFTTFEYKLLHVSFCLTFILWSMIGNTLHLMNSMVFFSLFAALLNKISEIEMKSFTKYNEVN
ncbi:MAG: O-antigen ligase family protein [Arcobacteraceae bacterium]